jgi:hypothetical protein
MSGGKPQGAPNRQAKLATDGTEFRKADTTEFRKAQAKVTEAEGYISLLGIDLAEKPSAVRIRRKEFHDRKVILVAVAAVRDQLPELRFGE